MGANTAGIYGAQIFRSDDAPRYRRAFVIGIGALSLGTLAAIVRKIDEILPWILVKVRRFLPGSIAAKVDGVVLRREQAAHAAETESTSESEDLKASAVPPADGFVAPVPVALGNGGTKLS